MNKRLYFFYLVEVLSVIAYTWFEGFSGILWSAVVISLLGILPRINSFADKLSSQTASILSQACLVLSSIIWGYMVMYFLSSAPKTLTVLLVARVIATIVGFKEIKDQAIIIIPLLIGFVFLQQEGCIPPLDF